MLARVLSVWRGVGVHPSIDGEVAERSKALVSGTSWIIQRKLLVRKGVSSNLTLVSRFVPLCMCIVVRCACAQIPPAEEAANRQVRRCLRKKQEGNRDRRAECPLLGVSVTARAPCRLACV